MLRPIRFLFLRAFLDLGDDRSPKLFAMVDEKLNEDQHELMAEHEAIVYHLVAKIRRNLPVHYEFDDLVGYGMLGLAEAAKAFQPAKGAKFSTFAYFRVRGAIFDGISESSWMNRAEYHRHKLKLQQQSEQGGADLGSLSRVVALEQEHLEQIAGQEEQAPYVEWLESSEILARCVNSLPMQDERLIQYIYFEGISLSEAAQRLAISKSWASRLHAKIIQKLGQKMKTYEDARLKRLIEELQ
ncbi:MAG: sigma-70 family RNA polymerase sigma factor [Planctomycetota bacterium]